MNASEIFITTHALHDLLKKQYERFSGALDHLLWRFQVTETMCAASRVVLHLCPQNVLLLELYGVGPEVCRPLMFSVTNQQHDNGGYGSFSANNMKHLLHLANSFRVETSDGQMRWDITLAGAPPTAPPIRARGPCDPDDMPTTRVHMRLDNVPLRARDEAKHYLDRLANRFVNTMMVLRDYRDAAFYEWRCERTPPQALHHLMAGGPAASAVVEDDSTLHDDSGWLPLAVAQQTVVGLRPGWASMGWYLGLQLNLDRTAGAHEPARANRFIFNGLELYMTSRAEIDQTLSHHVTDTTTPAEYDHLLRQLFGDMPYDNSQDLLLAYWSALTKVPASETLRAEMPAYRLVLLVHAPGVPLNEFEPEFMELSHIVADLIRAALAPLRPQLEPTIQRLRKMPQQP